MKRKETLDKGGNIGQRKGSGGVEDIEEGKILVWSKDIGVPSIGQIILKSVEHAVQLTALLTFYGILPAPIRSTLPLMVFRDPP